MHQIRLGSRRLENEEFSNFRVPTHSDRWHSGLVLGEITTNVARYLPAPSRQGAIVLDIAAGSPAFASRLRVGDIITSLGEGFADSPAEMVETIARAASKGESLKISARRGEQRIETSIRPVADAQSSSELDIPILLEYRKRADRTRFEVGFGWVMDYDRDSCFDSGGDPYDKWSFGMLFDLFEIRRTREKTEFNLLWLIRLSW